MTDICQKVLANLWDAIESDNMLQQNKNSKSDNMLQQKKMANNGQHQENRRLQNDKHFNVTGS